MEWELSGRVPTPTFCRVVCQWKRQRIQHILHGLSITNLINWGLPAQRGPPGVAGSVRGTVPLDSWSICAWLVANHWVGRRLTARTWVASPIRCPFILFWGMRNGPKTCRDHSRNAN